MERDGKLQKLRKELGYTQRDLGKMLGVRREQIAMYENGTRRPSVDFLLNIKETFNVSYTWIGEWACELAKQTRDVSTDN